MELNQIRYFLDVAETEHITKSAHRLHIAQPSLTKGIQRLEEELGVPLFINKGRNIFLSEYGKFFQKKMTSIIKEIDEIPEQLKTMAHLENQTISLNVLAASTLITDAVIEYNKTHENISFKLMQNDESDLYDIGVTTKMLYQVSEQDATHEFVFTEKIFLAVPSSHPLAKNDSISLSDAADERFISLMGSRQFRWICDRFCNHVGFAPNIIFESDNPATVKNMISAKMGVGFWPEYTWGELNTDSIKLLEITNPICRRDILFDYKLNKIDNTAVEGFFGFLRGFCIEKALNMR